MHWSSRLLSILVLTSFFVASFFFVVAPRLAAQSGGGPNPQVPQGGSASFLYAALEPPANGELWDILDPSQAVIATASQSLGWTVTFSSGTFTVSAPGTASIAPNYTVRYAASGTNGGGGTLRVKPNSASAPANPPAHNPTTVGSGTTASLEARQQASNARRRALLASARRPNGPPVADRPKSRIYPLHPAMTPGLNVVTPNVVVPSGNPHSSPFDVVSATGGGEPPAAPTNLVATATGPHRISLTWTDNATNENGFRIQRKQTSGQATNWATVASVGANSTGYSNLGVSASTTYVYRVCAYNLVGDSAWSNEASATTPAQGLLLGGSVGYEFWLPLPGSYITDGEGQHQFQVHITSEVNTTGVVTIPGLNFEQSFSVTAGSYTNVALPLEAGLNDEDAITSKGVHVVCDNPVSVSLINYAQYCTDSYLALPLTGLGTEYVALCFPTGSFYGSTDGFHTQISLAATVDNTTITITPQVNAGEPGQEHPAGIPYTVLLHSGQTYQLRASALGSDLTGTLVTASQPIAFTSGSQLADVPDAQYQAGNPLIEQLPPLDTWGQRFFAAPLATRSGGSLYRILAGRHNTVVTVNGVAYPALVRGTVLQLNITGPVYISSTKPVLVGQYSNGTQFDGATGDPFYSLVPATSQWKKNYTFACPETGFGANYLNIVGKTGAAINGDILLDGVAIPASNFTPISSTDGELCYAAVSVAPGGHQVSAVSTNTFSATVYGFGDDDGYGFPAGLNLSNRLIPNPTPNSPTNLVATAVSSEKIHLSWNDNSTTEEGFEVQRKKNDGTGSWQTLGITGVDVTSEDDEAGLFPGTAYLYRVRSFNSGGESAWSNEAGATTFDVPPAPPTVLTAAAVSQTEIHLAWSDNSGNEQGFVIERKTGANGTWSQIASVGAGIHAHTDSGLTKQTLYVYRVRAFNTIGDSDWSNEAAATTLDDPPSAPTGLTATAVSATQIDLSWTDTSNNESGFRIERTTGSGGIWTEIASVGANATSYQDTGLQSETTYTYRVRAYNNGGASG